MKRLNFILAVLFLSFYSLNAQNVAINDDNSTGDANAILDVKSTTKGILVPRMTRAERITLGDKSPTPGLLVFDTDTESYWFKISGDDEKQWAALGTPPGTIIAFGDNTPPLKGYLICDGSEYHKDSYPDLFEAIGTTWGGDGTPMFNVPDLRGHFLRGWDNGAGNDPDAGTRTDAPGSNSQVGDIVGSYQSDEYKEHTHNYTNPTLPSSAYGMQVDMNGSAREYPTPNGGTTSSEGGNETRPKNAYVYYLIKY